MKKPKIREDTVREVFLVAGFFMVGFGFWCIFPPAAWLVCGGILLWLGIPPKQAMRKEGD